MNSLFYSKIVELDFLLLNDKKLDTTRRLSNGDNVKFFGSVIRIIINEQGITLDIHLEDSAYVTKPPKFDETLSEQEYKKITPITFRPTVSDNKDLLFFKKL